MSIHSRKKCGSRMRCRGTLVVIAFFAAFAPYGSRAATTTISDQSFTPGTWTLGVLNGTNVVTASLAQEPGAGVTGSAQRTTLTGSGSYTFDIDHFKLDRVWTPGVDGVIQHIDWEIWYKTANASNFAGMWLALRQGSSSFRAPSSYFEPQDFSPNWQRTTRPVPIGDFIQYAGLVGETLDFSIDAEPIELGYQLARGVFRSGTTTYRASFYVATITSIPAVLSGDYNNDGVVDAADYTVWRDNEGAPAGTLPNDTAGGVIGSAQYGVWSENFGTKRPSTAAESTPEPSGAGLVGVLLAAAGLVTSPRTTR